MPSSDFQAALPFGRLLSHREREGGREGGRDRRTEGQRERGGQKESICLTSLLHVVEEDKSTG